MSEEPVKDCPKCGKDVRRVINGGAGIIFKGSGFYVNDSKGKNSTVSSSSKSGSQTGESTGGDSSKGDASSSNVDKKSSGDSGNSSVPTPAASGSKPESRAGAKESA
jgi:predicted nucleic acid-binding Zn ribbon protein